MARLLTGILIQAKDAATPVIRKVGRGVNDFAVKGKKALASFGKAVVVMNQGWQLAGRIFRVTLGPVVNLLKASAQKALEFGKAMAEVSTLVDTNVVSMDKLNDVTLALAMEYGKSPVDQAKALYTAISAGANAGAESISLMNAANMMAIGGVTEVESAVDGLTSVINSYGVSFLDAENVSDKFFQTIKLGKTTATELAANIGKVTTGAAAAGVSMDEMFAAIAAGTKVGLNTAMVTTGLNAAITALTGPTNDAKNVAAQMGIEFNAAALESKGLVGVLREIQGTGKGTKENLEKLFGSVRAGRVVTALMNNDFREINKILPQLQNSAGSTAEAFQKMSKTAGFQINRLKATFEAAQILLGKLGTESQGFGSILKGMVDGLKIVVTALKGMALGFGQGKTELYEFGRNLVIVGGQMFTMGVKTLAFLTEQFYALHAGISIVVNTLKIFQKTTKFEEYETQLESNVQKLERMAVETKRARAAYEGFVNGYTSVSEAIKHNAAEEERLRKIYLGKVKAMKAQQKANDEYKATVLGELDASNALNAANARTVTTLGQIKDLSGELSTALDTLNASINDPAALDKTNKQWAGILKIVSDAQDALTKDDKKKDAGPAEGAEAASERIIKTYQSQFAAYIKMSTSMMNMDEFLHQKRIALIDMASAKQGKDGKKLAQEAIKRAEKAFVAEKKAAALRMQTARETGEARNKIEEDSAERRLVLNVKTQEAERRTAESIASFAAQAGQQVYNLGRGLVTDLMDSTVSAEEAIQNLANSTLTYLAETLAQWTLTEGIKRAVMWATVGQKEAADKAKLISGVTTDTAETASNAAALSMQSGMKAQETTAAIGMDSARGQSGIMAFFAGLGPVGIALGLAAAAVVGAAIYGLIKLIQPQKFAQGGLVTGGTPGKDSVSALLMPGEYVLNKSTVDSIRRGAPPKSPGMYASGGMVTAGGSLGGSSVIFQPIIQTLALPNSVQNQRYYRDTVSRTRQRLNKNGYSG